MKNKRCFIFIILLTLLCRGIYVQAGGLFLTDDFESYPTGAFSSGGGWSIYDKAATGGKIEIVREGQNQACKISVDYVENASGWYDAYIESGFVSAARPFRAQAKMKNAASAKGALAMRLRDDGVSSRTLDFVTISKGKINYLPGLASPAVSESIGDGDWASVTAYADPATGALWVYRDGILKASVPNFRAVEAFANFNLNSFKLRLQSNIIKGTAGTLTTYVDQVEFTENASLTEALWVKRPQAFLRLPERDIAVSQLRDGTLRVVTEVENRGTATADARQVLAFTRNGKLRKVALSKPVTIPPGQTAPAESDITLEQTEKGDELKIYLLRDLDSVLPLSYCDALERPGFVPPLAEELAAGFENAHPRIVASKTDFDRLREEYQADPYLKTWSAAVLRQAENIVKADINQQGGYYIGYVIPDGLRLLNMSRRVLDFQQCLGMAYQLTGDRRYAEKAWMILEKAGARDGAIAPEQFPDWNPVHYLDTAEMTAAFAIGYDWMYDYFSEPQRQYIRQSIIRYGLDLAEKAYRGEEIPGKPWWVNVKHNWNAVCNGGMLMGALAIAEDNRAQSFAVAEGALRGLADMLPSFAPDGAWVEGPGYWGYTLKYLSMLDATLRASVGTDFGIAQADGMERTGEFILQLDGPCGTNNFHDAGAGHINQPEVFWLSSICQNPGLAAARLQNMQSYGLSGGVMDLLWYETKTGGQEVGLPKDAYFRAAETGCFRSGWNGTQDTWLSFHGGKNNVNHTHLDNGTFVFDALGKRWAEDLGSDGLTYDNSYTGSRWDVYRTRAEGHNTLVINPDNSPGQDLSADTPILRFTSEPECARAVMDLSSAYSAQASRVLRGYKMEEGRQTVTIRDELELKKDGAEVYWFLHTKASPVVAGKYVLLSQGGEMMKLEFSVTGAGSASLSVMDAAPLPTSPNPDGQEKNTGIKKVAIRVVGSGAVAITVKLSPVLAGAEFAPLDNTPLSEW